MYYKYDVKSGKSERIDGILGGPDWIELGTTQQTFTAAGFYNARAWHLGQSKPVWSLDYDIDLEPLSGTPDGKGVLFYEHNQGGGCLRILNSTPKSLLGPRR